MSDYDLKYKNKYLKYKNKYLDLKNQTGGNFFTKFLPPSMLNNFLKDTILTYDQIDNREALQIAELMKINTTATTLNLTNSLLSDEVYKILGEALLENKTLKTLNLTNNSIKIIQLEYLINGLKTNTTLQTLDLTDNDLYDIGGSKIADFIEQNETITNIILKGTSIRNQSDKNRQIITTANYKARIIKALNRNQSKKIFIDTIDNKTLEELTEFLNNYTILDLTNTTISDKGFANLSDALKTNTTLKTLKIGSNKIQDKGFANLSDALKTNTTLKTLKIGSNKIQDKDTFLFNLFSALKISKTLTTLYLVDMELEDIDAERINSLLQFNTTLTTLDLLNNNFTEKGKEEFNIVKKRITITF